MRIPDAYVLKDVAYGVKNTAAIGSTDPIDKIGTDAAGVPVAGLAITEGNLLTEGSAAIVEEDGKILLSGSHPTKDFQIYINTGFNVEKSPVINKDFKYTKTSAVDGQKQVTIFGSDSNDDGADLDVFVAGSPVEDEDVGFIIHMNKSDSTVKAIQREVTIPLTASDTPATVIEKLVKLINQYCSDFVVASATSNVGIKFESKTYYDHFSVVPIGFTGGTLAEGAGSTNDVHGAVIDHKYYSTPSSHPDFTNDDIDAVKGIEPVGYSKHVEEALKAGDTNRGGNSTYVNYSIPMFKGAIMPESGVKYDQLIIEWSNTVRRSLPATAADFKQTLVLFVPNTDTNGILTYLDSILNV